MIREQIEEKLRNAFTPAHLEVHDESYRHNVPAGSESHFKVVIVSDHFTGQRFLQRHRAIYGAAYLHAKRVARAAGYCPGFA